LQRYPGELTASEQQRVAIARAIIARPSFVVVDEATSNLDARSRSTILDVLIRLQRELGVCYLFVSHDLTAVEKVSHRIAIMYLGRIVEVATKTAIMRKQLHPYSRALLSAVLYPDPSRRLEQFTLEGEIPSGINPPDECPLVGRCPLAVPMCREAFPPLEEVESDHYSACYRSRDLAGSNGLGGSVDSTEASVPIGEIANTEGRIGGSGL
jgi:oligopeptide/dipeptide ABC transporter ATP-binding protein